MSKNLINKPFPLSQEQIDFFRENQYIKLKNVLDATTIAIYKKAIEEEVAQLSKDALPIEERDTYNKAFLQVTNLWRHNEKVKELVFGKRIAQIATQLMKVNGVRLYHDQALFKEPEGGFTPWHADQYYWPLSNDHTVTAWIPLQATSLEMGPLEFSAKSFQLKDGRDLKISDDSEKVISSKLRLNDFETIVEPFELGEVSFHSGWIFHRAGENNTNQMRSAMTIIYMDKDMKLKKPENPNQKADWEAWCPEIQIGEIINSPLTPVLYP